MSAKTIITICCSVSFYRQANDAQDELEARGYKVIVPITATGMRKTGDYDVSHNKTWFKNADDYHRKTELMRSHFDAIEKSDAILVINNEKHGVPNYIGGNVLMEMALAFHRHKPIYILNEIPKESNFLEEIIGLEPIVLHGKLEDLAL